MASAVPVPPGNDADAVRRLEREVEELRQRLQRRAAIEQVKGMLTLTYGLDDDDAFAVLLTVSQNTNVKLGTAAELVRDAVVESAGAGTRNRCHTALLDVYEHLRNSP